MARLSRFALFYLSSALTVLAYLAAASVAGCGGGLPILCSPACAPGFTCTSGTCVRGGPGVDAGLPDLATGHCAPACAGAAPWCLPSNRCGACRDDADCPVGRVCKPSKDGTSLCAPGCTDDSRCGGTGGLGARCCSAACVDTRSDAANCGDCGKACSIANAVAACVGGACKTGSCNTGWGDCNGDPKDGCEANLHTDAANCGGCGKACLIPHAVAGCSSFGAPDAGAGDCYIAACNYGYDDCDGDPSNGCETSVATDAKNCGGCGNACKPPPNAKVVCANQVCAVASCTQGFADCNMLPNDGCEANVATDAKNCGACNAACAAGLVCVAGLCTCPQCKIPNASSKCINNTCILDHCNPGFFDCNNNPADGCEANLNDDPRNCGGCGTVCPPQMPGCNVGVCAMGCLNGKMPPAPCVAGKDPENGSPWVICQADCTSAWIGANTSGNFHATQICMLLGYSRLGRFGGTCGMVCAYCGPGSCNAPGNMKFDTNGSCGMDANGPILCSTVMWECLK